MNLPSSRLLLTVLAAALGLSLPLRAAVIVLPITSGQASGSGYIGGSGATDVQPLSVPTVGNITVTGGHLGNNVDSYGTPRQMYIDFGTAFSSLVISETWTAYNAYSNVDGSNCFTALWWSSSTDSVFDGGDIAVSAFNFGTQAVNLSGDPSDTVAWTRDSTGLSVTPLARYLVLSYSGASIFGDGRVTELAVVGTVVPEPASLMLLAGAGSFLVVMRRRLRR